MVTSKNRGMHFIDLYVNSNLPKTEEICHLLELSNPPFRGISETKLDGSVLNSEIVIKGYGLMTLGCSRKKAGVACFIKHSATDSYKTKSTKSTFAEIYLPKSKQL